MDKKLPNPAVYSADGLVVDLEDVSTVICAIESNQRSLSSVDTVSVCRVILKSGTSFTVDMKYSRSLIQAVEWSRSPGSVARPKGGILDDGELVANSWNWDDQRVS